MNNDDFKENLEEKLKDPAVVAYYILITNYEKVMKEIGKKDMQLYPMEWYLIKDKQIQNAILVEAIKNKKLIINTKKYQPYIEGFRRG